VKPLDIAGVALRGTHVIEASAGTGKTYTITSLFLRLLVEEELSIDQILVVTYTRAATAELRDRVRARLNAALLCARGEASDDPFLVALCRGKDPARLENALCNVDQAPILTIHAFCQRVLRDQAFESGAGFSMQLTAYAASIVEEIACDYYTSRLFEMSRERAGALVSELPVLLELARRAGAPHRRPAGRSGRGGVTRWSSRSSP
jgi:exodeoxyribonuclease V beta subunit